MREYVENEVLPVCRCESTGCWERLRTDDAFRPLLVHTSLLPSLYSLFILACNRSQSFLVSRRPSLLFFFFFPSSLYSAPFIRFRCWLNVLNRETTVNGFVEERRLFETVSLPSLCLYIYIYIYGKEMSDEFENRGGAVVDSKEFSPPFFLNGLRKLVILLCFMARDSSLRFLLPFFRLDAVERSTMPSSSSSFL